jgi:hypothetical protein
MEGRITLEWILGKYGRTFWIGCVWLRKETNGRFL